MRNEPWIQVIVVVIVFLVGNVLLKSYNKYILKLETSVNLIEKKRWDSTFSDAGKN